MPDKQVSQSVQWETIAISEGDKLNEEALEYVRQQIDNALRLRLDVAIIFGVSLSRVNHSAAQANETGKA
jgi:hypothetical protein